MTNAASFTMPNFGQASQAFSVSSQMVANALELVQDLTAASNFTPLTLTFPNITVAGSPKPVDPPPPGLISVAWITPTPPQTFNQPVPQISQLFPSPLTAVQPVLNFGNAPAAFAGVVPQEPAIDTNFTYPVPSVTIPPAPSLLTLNVLDFNPFEIPTFTGQVPTLDLVAPNPLNWTEGATFTSDLLTTIQDEMISALTTDTDIGLTASIQQAMWDAATEREYRAQADALADLERLEGMGFALPSGIYLDARLKIQTETDYTRTGLSRDIMIKQAQLRLDNVTHCREIAVTLEGQLITYANAVQQRAFDFVKYQTEAMISIYNAEVQAYTARVEGFKATIAVFDAQIRGIEAQIEQLKAQVEYEQTKAQINTDLVNMYKTQIDAALSILEVAKVQVQIIQTEAEVEKLKVDVYSAEIQAYVGQVNAYTAQVEAYKANVEAQEAIESVYKTQVDAYTSTVQAGTAQATALIDGYKAQVAGYEAQLDAYKAQLQAMVEQARAASEYNQALTAEYAAQVQATSAVNEVLVKEWQAVITEQLQFAEVASKVAEANVQLQISQRNVVIAAVKGAASVMAQLGAAALGAIHWSSNANWSDGLSVSISQSTSNSTSDDHIFSESA